MSGALFGALAVALLAGTGLAVASLLGVRGWARLLLGAYVVAFSEVVGLTLVLSPFEAVTRTALLIGLALLLVVAVAVWILLGAPRLPPLPLEHIRALARVPVLLVLATIVGLALAYVVALIVGTPPNTWDSLAYHLARAAFWRQAGGVGNIENAYDERLEIAPPNAEIALTFVLELTRNEHFAGFVQFAAALATVIGIFALARMLGLARHEAAFGALLFLTLPIVLLESSTTQNDLVAASLLVAAAVFVSGGSRGDLVLVALATGLAVGTKIPAVFGLPVLAAIALVAPPRSARTERIIALVVGAAVGSYWYVANLVRTGHPLGDAPDPTGLVALLDPKRNLLSAYARILDAFDLSGAEGADLYLYAVVAAVIAVAVLLVSLPVRARSVGIALATGALAALPLAFIPVSYVLWRPFAKLHDILEEPDDGLLPVAGWERQDSASDTFSWFGPLGLLLVVGVGVVAVVLVRRRSLPPLALVFVTAPLVWLLLLSVSVGYDPWQGRFFIFPVALSAALWGLVLRVRAAAIASVAIAATTATLTLVHFIEKPAGLRLLDGDVPPSVWSMEGRQAQSLLRAEMTPVLEFLAERVPHDAAIALALRGDDFGFPAFGPRLERRVVLVAEDGGDSPVDAEWLLASPAHASAFRRPCWQVELSTPEGWKAFRATASEESC